MTIYTKAIFALLIAATSWPSVCGAGTLHIPADFPTIQACINAAVGRVDECVVAPGTYYEKINFLGKAITLRSSDGAEVTTIDASSGNAVFGCALHHFHIGTAVTCHCGEGPDTILDGFTITGGTGTYTNSSGDPTIGGGMLILNSSPTVNNCIFRGNFATEGGGMVNGSSCPTINNCTFHENRAPDGGGMLNSHSNTIISNCTFIGNTASFGTGGGIYNAFSNPTLTNCVFSGNRADQYFLGGGAAIFNYRSDATVTNCSFSGNLGSIGSGMWNDQSNPIVTNSILWDSSHNEVVNTDQSAPTFRYCDLKGGMPFGAVDGGGNIDLDPLFIRMPNPGPDGTWDGVADDYGDLRLRSGSACINAGDPGFIVQIGDSDLDGHPRLLCARVDLGAYEFGIGDYDCDQFVDLGDFSNWNSCMTGPNSGSYEVGCEGFDFNAAGDVDLSDFASFQCFVKP